MTMLIIILNIILLIIYGRIAILNSILVEKIKQDFEDKVKSLIKYGSIRILFFYGKNEIEIVRIINDENYLTATINYDNFFDMTSESGFKKIISVLEELEVVEEEYVEFSPEVIKKMRN